MLYPNTTILSSRPVKYIFRLLNLLILGLRLQIKPHRPIADALIDLNVS